MEIDEVLRWRNAFRENFPDKHPMRREDFLRRVETVVRSSNMKDYDAGGYVLYHNLNPIGYFEYYRILRYVHFTFWKNPDREHVGRLLLDGVHHHLHYHMDYEFADVFIRPYTAEIQHLVKVYGWKDVTQNYLPLQNEVRCYRWSIR